MYKLTNYIAYAECDRKQILMALHILIALQILIYGIAAFDYLCYISVLKI